MTYLVKSMFGIKEIEKYKEVLNILKQYTAYWCAKEDYQGKDYQTLYNYCLEKHNFGDIAHVFQIDAYFKIGKEQIPCGLYSADTNTDFTIKRIL